MNERIRELSDIAYKNHLARNPHSSYGRRSDYDREFAELIVKECVAICEDTDGEHIADAKWGRRCCALEIREHFGVEE
jgi:hypothetical protein